MCAFGPRHRQALSSVDPRHARRKRLRVAPVALRERLTASVCDGSRWSPRHQRKGTTNGSAEDDAVKGLHRDPSALSEAKEDGWKALDGGEAGVSPETLPPKERETEGFPFPGPRERWEGSGEAKPFPGTHTDRRPQGLLQPP